MQFPRLVLFLSLIFAASLVLCGCGGTAMSSNTGTPSGGSGSGTGTGGNAQVSFSTTTFSSSNLLWNYDFRFPGTVLADLNGDGRDDFVTAGLCPTNGEFSVRLSTGDGIYAPSVCYTIPTATLNTVPLNPTGFMAGNFFADGHTDIAVSDERNNLSIWKNAAGNGILTLGSSMTPPNGDSCAYAADVNHDGKTDLICIQNTSSSFTAQIQVLFGNGDGTFTPGPSTSFTMQVQPAVEGVGDFDGDGNVDVMASNADGSAQETEILYGDGAGNFNPGPSLLGSNFQQSNATYTVYQPFDVTSGDLADLIGSPITYAPCPGCLAATATGNNYLNIEFGNSNRTLTSDKVTLENCTVSTAPPQVADFDGDGIPDIIVAEGPCQAIGTSGTETLDFLKGNGDGTFQPEQVVYSTSDVIGEWHVLKPSQSGKPGLTLVQWQNVNDTITNQEELILVNTTP
jgi:hypothetical protein